MEELKDPTTPSERRETIEGISEKLRIVAQECAENELGHLEVGTDSGRIVWMPKIGR